MPTELGRRFPVSWEGKPAGMLEPDIPVWYRFLRKYGYGFLGVYYNSYFGGPWLTREQEEDPMMRMWRAKNVKRTDAIAELENEIWIIEVAAYPGQRSLGQLLNYQTMWLEDPKIEKMERLVLVCERIDPDIGATYAKFGVMIYIV
ncbi:MAG: hypothetical protein Q7J98_10240 [Kiritimatiellia bacterium]|nr:hypothetical protein [Kiritimatiellia bacterium]